MTKGLISKLQAYATKDGPGIRTTVFCIGCNLRCRWCSNPEAMFFGKKVLYYAQKCKHCGCCVAASDGIIIMKETGCYIDRSRCGDLEPMVDLCPYDAYEYSGLEYTPAQLHKMLMKDATFYRTSGGGVTFSGGEACLQVDFVLQTAQLLKQDGVHVALDTAGLWDFQTVRPLLEQVDLVLYDIKAIDPTIHQAWTGQPNDVILENARRIAAMGRSMHIRMVLIPGVNDTPQELKSRMEFACSLGSAVERIDVLPYHTLGTGKYEALQLPYPMPVLSAHTDAQLEQMLAPYQKLPIPITVGG